MEHSTSTSLDEHVIGHDSHRLCVRRMCYSCKRNMLGISLSHSIHQKDQLLSRNVLS